VIRGAAGGGGGGGEFVRVGSRREILIFGIQNVQHAVVRSSSMCRCFGCLLEKFGLFLVERGQPLFIVFDLLSRCGSGSGRKLDLFLGRLSGFGDLVFVLVLGDALLFLFGFFRLVTFGCLFLLDRFDGDGG